MTPQRDILRKTPLAAAFPELARAAGRHKARLSHLRPGRLVAGEGIFVFRWDTGKGGLPFNVFAAPEDLNIPDRACFGLSTSYFSYDGAVHYIAGLRNWHGHDGTCYENEHKFYQAVYEGTYNGGWFMPTYGFQKHLFTHRNRGDLKKSFNSLKEAYEPVYWSMRTPEHPGAFALCFNTGAERYEETGRFTIYKARPLRLSPAFL